MTASARIELAGVQILCRQPKTRIDLAGVSLVCKQAKCRTDLAGIQVIALPEFYEEEYPVFPSMARNYWPENFNYPQGILVNPTIGVDVVSGTPSYRSGYQVQNRTWAFTLRHLTADQKQELESFQEEVGWGSDPFYWTDVRPTSASGASGGSGGTYLVLFAAPLVFDLDDEAETYRCEVSLDEWDGGV